MRVHNRRILADQQHAQPVLHLSSVWRACCSDSQTQNSSPATGTELSPIICTAMLGPASEVSPALSLSWRTCSHTQPLFKTNGAMLARFQCTKLRLVA